MSEVHEVPHGRPLPDLVEGGLVAVCPELVPRRLEVRFQAGSRLVAASSRSSVGTDTRDLRIPVATYLYDQRIALCLHHLLVCTSDPYSVATQGEEFGGALDQGMTCKMVKVSKFRTPTRGMCR